MTDGDDLPVRARADALAVLTDRGGVDEAEAAALLDAAISHPDQWVQYICCRVKFEILPYWKTFSSL